MARKVTATTIAIPTRGDRNQWLAGGDLRSDTQAGGELWSPTEVANIEIMRPSAGKEAMLMTGNLEGYLGHPRLQIEKKLEARELNTIYEENKIITTSILLLTVTVSSETGYSLSLEDSVEMDDLGNLVGRVGDYSDVSDLLGSINADKQTTTEIVIGTFGQMLMKAPMGSLLAVSMYNSVTGKTERVEQAIGAYTLGQTRSMVTTGLTRAVANVAGITNTVAGIGLVTLVGALVTEAFEVAIGTDSSFGFGGEFLGRVGDQDYFSTEQDFVSGAKDLAGEFLESVSLGLFEYTSQLDVDRARYEMDRDRLGGTDDMGDFTALNPLQGPVEAPSQWYDAISGRSSFSNPSITDANNFSDFDDAYGHHQEAADAYGSKGDSEEEDSGGTYCCTAMNTAGKWKMVRTARMEKWHKTQPRWWRLGYDTWGKVVAKYVVRDGEGYGGTMIDAFYDTKVNGKKASLDTYMSYLVIYSGVLICGLYKLSTDKVAKCYNNKKLKD